MAYCISEDCVGCGDCADQCPAGAIKGNKKGYAIDSDKCTECGSCADICPVAAAKKD
ncbi:MAG: 4Fe-4S dicluster domain-containing protein [Eubacteriales bacterium]|nr:MAG: 4Fe-4S ferredoxin [Firmicutes bacterium HGW-Firmicutes-8]